MEMEAGGEGGREGEGGGEVERVSKRGKREREREAETGTKGGREKFIFVNGCVHFRHTKAMLTFDKLGCDGKMDRGRRGEGGEGCAYVCV